MLRAFGQERKLRRRKKKEAEEVMRKYKIYSSKARQTS
jgi:hypothetical protein